MRRGTPRRFPIRPGIRRDRARALPRGRGRTGLVLAAVLAVVPASSGCGIRTERWSRPVSGVTAVQTIDPGVVPGLDVETRTGDGPERHMYAAYPRIPGADPLTDRLASAVDDRIRAFEADTADTARGRDGDAPAASSGGRAPELNVQWSLTAASGQVAGVRLVTWQYLGASGGETRRTFWYDGTTGRAHPSSDLLDGDRGLDALARLVRDRLGARGDPGQVEADARAFPSLVFNEAGDLVVEFSDFTVAPRSAGRVAVALGREDYDPLLSDVGRRARDAAVAVRPRPALAAAEPDARPTPSPSVPPPAAPSPSGTSRPDCARAKCVALTFDDGPGPVTRRLLDALARRQARATFFVVGGSAHAYPDTIRRIAAAGHELGNHTQNHRDLGRLPALQVNTDIQATQQVLRTVLGRAPVLLRPPYGSTNGTVEGVAGSLGLRQVGWSADPGDRGEDDAGTIADRTVDAARPGGIVLLHDGHGPTADAVPAIVDRLAGDGYTLVTVSDLLAGQTPRHGG